jgi:hypothetical protein
MSINPYHLGGVPEYMDYKRAIYAFSDEMAQMARDGISEDSEEFQRVKAQWAYACAMRDFQATRGITSPESSH